MTDVEIEFAPTVEATLVYKRGLPAPPTGRQRRCRQRRSPRRIEEQCIAVVPRAPGPPKAVDAATTDRSAEEFRGRESGSSGEWASRDWRR
jgi:hypothetical protein